MRPASDPHLALVLAAQHLKIERAQSGQGATLRELIIRSRVGYAVARALVPKLKARGKLQIVGERQVSYRNRPVAEYAPSATGPVLSETDVQELAWVDLSRCMGRWAK